MPGAGFTLSKEERISSRKDIAALLAGGRWFSAGVLKACAAPNGLEFSRILVSVPKRLFKRAVKRNLLKRRIRESYRLQKVLAGGACVDILFQYNDPQVADFDVIREDVAAILKKFAK